MENWPYSDAMKLAKNACEA